jgi:peptidoglycan/LPS O-acetylase OafA/YrhL
MIEELFYLTLPTVIWLGFFKKNWKVALLTMLAISVTYRYFIVDVLNSGTTNYLNAQILSFLFLYSMGIILGLGKSLQLGKYKYLIPLAFCVMVFTMGDAFQVWWSPFVIAVIGYLILANFEKSRFFTNRISVFYGKISYSFYLLSVLVGPLVVVFDKALGGKLVDEPILSVAWLLGSFALITLISYLTYNYIERAFILFGRKIIYPKQSGTLVLTQIPPDSPRP